MDTPDIELPPDPESEVRPLTTSLQPVTLQPSHPYNYKGEQLDCENLDNVEPHSYYTYDESFIVNLFRFFGNIVVDTIRAIF